MRIRRQPRQADPRRRGAALMLSLLVLFILILIVSQISYSTKTDARVERNETALTAMDLAIESVLLQAYDDLASDAQAEAAGGGGLGGAFGGGGAGGAEGGGAGPSDSREDSWARPQRTELNELQLRVLVQDEDSKFNLLSILAEDDDEAEEAFERLVRVIENARKGTTAEIDPGRARRMADAMREFLERRRDQVLPKPELLSDSEEDRDLGLPLTLRELVAVDTELFPPDLFRDFRDENDRIVHSLGSFLTVHSSLRTPGEDPRQAAAGASPPPDGEGGGEMDAAEGSGEEEPQELEGGEGTQAGPQGVPEEAGGPPAPAPDGKMNVNTAPLAVLAALLDDRDVPYYFWDELIEFRNEPQDEDAEEEEDVPLDEYGEPIVPKKFFTSFEDLSQIDGWSEIDPAVQGELRSLLKPTSSVFSVFVTARRPTGEERIDPGSRREDIEREEAEGQGLVRTVRSVVWRRTTGGGEAEIVPLVRWEALDYVPYEVRDFPDEDR